MADKAVKDEFPTVRPEAVSAVPKGVMQDWSFMYGISPSVKMPGQVRASTEEKAVQVAQRWCDTVGFRFIGARVRPVILADESILNLKSIEQPA